MKKKFLTCGILGWCMEIMFTGLHSVRNKEMTLEASTSLWMFPIYGMACLLTPVCHALKGKSALLRGSIYTLCIYTGEFLTGLFLKKHDACPWDYSQARFNVKGLIRFDYAPLWFGAGLAFEKILCKKDL